MYCTTGELETGHRAYEPNGANGALFVVSHPSEDFRTMEIFFQMNAFVCEVSGYE